MKRRPVQATLLGALALGCGSDITAPNLPAKPAAPAVTLGSLFSCALTLDAKPYCWGDNLSGQLGDSSFASRLVPGAVAGGHSFIAISSSVSTACALEQNGAVWCWGDDPTQPGVRLSLRNLPIAIPLPRPMVTIAVGRKSACGLDSGWRLHTVGAKTDAGSLGWATRCRMRIQPACSARSSSRRSARGSGVPALCRRRAASIVGATTPTARWERATRCLALAPKQDQWDRRRFVRDIRVDPRVRRSRRQAPRCAGAPTSPVNWVTERRLVA